MLDVKGIWEAHGPLRENSGGKLQNVVRNSIDDCLGETGLNADGRMEILCDLSSVVSTDSLLEAKPDLYVVLYDDGRETFRSPVFRDRDFLVRDPVTAPQNQRTQDLGTFTIEN